MYVVPAPKKCKLLQIMFALFANPSLLENLLKKAVNQSTIHNNEQMDNCQEKQIPKNIVQ